jgi:hypothetical protein
MNAFFAVTAALWYALSMLLLTLTFPSAISGQAESQLKSASATVKVLYILEGATEESENEGAK